MIRLAHVLAAVVTAGLFPSWTRPAAPFHIVGNTYEVGSEGLSMLLIRTSDGLILIDGGMPGWGAEVVASVRALGFDPKRVRWILNSHAHLDHAGALAELKALTGGKVAMMAQDVPAAERGAYIGSEENHALDFPAVKVDRVLKDGDVIRLGDAALTAHLTPGHTAGCTTWTWTTREAGRDLTVLNYCSTSVAANRLVGRPQYAGIVADYRKSFARLKTMQADVFLAPHAEQFGLAAKHAKGAPDAFVDPAELQRRVAESEADFDKALAAQEAKR